MVNGNMILYQKIDMGDKVKRYSISKIWKCQYTNCNIICFIIFIKKNYIRLFSGLLIKEISDYLIYAIIATSLYITLMI